MSVVSKRFLMLLLVLCGVRNAESFLATSGRVSCSSSGMMLCAALDQPEETSNGKNATDVQVFRKSKKKEYKIVDRRDALPFSVQLQPAPSDALLRSTVYSCNGDDEIPKVLLGEFALDASTTSGDTIGIGTQLYRVVRHRCLYQYRGRQQFHMVRKILEVKELQRYRAEESLQRQFALSAPPEEEEEAH